MAFPYNHHTIANKVLHIVILLFIINSLLLGQKVRLERKNIVKLKAGYILCADDRLVEAKNDTVIELPRYIDFYIRKGSNTTSDRFYQELRDQAFRTKWGKELHNVVLSPSTDLFSKTDTVKTQKSEIAFLPYNGLIIRNIYITRLDVFGPRINDPERLPNTMIEKSANGIHIKTRNSVIKEHLLFNVGDTIDPYEVADNERILRQLNFIEDARIVVKNINETSDSADVEIITKDRWSIGIDFTTADLKNMYLNVWDNNIFGLGHEFNNTYFWNPNKMPTSGLNGSYSVSNINGSFINARLGYNTFGNQDYSVNVWRDFYARQTSYAGAVYYENIHHKYMYVNDLQDSFYYANLSGNIFNIWLGRALPIGRLSITSTSISNIFLSAGVFSNKFSERPLPTADYRYEFQNKTFYLSSLAFSAQGFYKTNLVYNYGRTEDIPYGLLLKFTQGFEVSEFATRWYTGVSLSRAKFVGNLGYIYGSVGLGGFVYKEKFEQGVLKLTYNMYTNLFVLGQFKFRNFAGANFVKGYHRNNDELLYLNDLEGIRGFRYDTARGRAKANNKPRIGLFYAILCWWISGGGLFICRFCLCWPSIQIGI